MAAPLSHAGYVAVCYSLGVFLIVAFAIYAVAYGAWFQRRRMRIVDTEGFTTARGTQSMGRIGWSFFCGAVGAWRARKGVSSRLCAARQVPHERPEGPDPAGGEGVGQLERAARRRFDEEAHADCGQNAALAELPSGVETLW